MTKTVKVVETELKPVGPDSRKSFCRKAFVLDDLNGTRYLKSYETIICSADADGYVRKYAEIRSATTNRHLRSFLRLYAPKTEAADVKKMAVEKSRPGLAVVN